MKRAFTSVSRGLLLIVLGFIFFMLNYGVLSWSLWAHVIDLWPLILILTGIGLFFNRQIPLSAVLLIFLLSMVGYSLAVGDKPGPIPRYHSFNSVSDGTGGIDVPLPTDVKKAQVNLKLGGAQVQVKDLDSGSNGGQLMTGTYKWASRSLNPDPRTSVVQIKQSGDTLTATLSSPGGKGERNLSDIALNLSPKIHYDLDINAGAINGMIDLGRLMVDNLKISTGASNFELQFGETGIATQGKIDSGASKLTLVVPESVGLQIRLNGVATSTDFMGSGLLLEDKKWISSNYSDAKTKIDLEISTAAGTVRLERPKLSIQ
ncbi:hypothetical protein UF75_2035 [Desulfosporosinus sp. I2]|uniref:LiaI-LiaF-like domain-containing protein n=1 Tax=Desulfosporosinus sp. I2 TaxID=1617025 RepID=UPI0005ED607A|nr:DUF5668 domain-containing protein [Desulfosporosinus sp. I2]KJR47609.1 hypothetical protein UF75_2035 [Desulfosporosinus sp. I2]